jgi:deoxyribodipyrimidine photo-lyase
MRFDPRGRYVRRWLPELSKLPDAFVHRPWEAPPLALAEAGVTLDENYPEPIVDHTERRVLALEMYGEVKRARAGA